MTGQRERIDEMIEELELSHWYGSLEVKFEKGEVTIIRKSETIKINANGNYNRSNRLYDRPR